MTTITTEIVLRTAPLCEDERLQRGDLPALLRDRAASQWLAQRLVQHARAQWPGRHWTVTDLLDLLSTAVHGVRSSQPRVIEARSVRRHLRERCRLAERYGEPLGLVVLQLLPERAATRYVTAVDRVLQRMRPEDALALFRRHVLFLLPRLPPGALPTVADRLQGTMREALGAPSLGTLETYSYEPRAGTLQPQDALDWLEDRLRNGPS